MKRKSGYVDLKSFFCTRKLKDSGFETALRLVQSQARDTKVTSGTQDDKRLGLLKLISTAYGFLVFRSRGASSVEIHQYHLFTIGSLSKHDVDESENVI